MFERFPFVDVAFGPGQIHRLAEFLTQDSLTAQGYFEFEGFPGHLPAKRERRVPGLGADLGRLQLRLRLLHRAPDPRPRGQPRPDELIAEVERPGRGRRARGHPAGPEREQLRPRPPAPRSGSTFAELLGRIDAVDGIERIRYTSPHPKDMREDVIRAHAELPALCSHIHLPVQSGSSRVLKAMRRTYNRERYLDRVAQIRTHVPDCALTTDIIVGFPGETEADFAETLELVERGRATTAPSPSSSRRAGAPRRRRCPIRFPTRSSASAWSGSWSWCRRGRASALSASSVATMEVLVEGPSRTDPTRLRGRSSHNKTVNFDGRRRAGRAGRGRDRGGHVDHPLGPPEAALGHRAGAGYGLGDV